MLLQDAEVQVSAVAMAVNMAPYVCIWLVIRDLVAAAPDWTEATGIANYGWAAFGFAVAGIVVYFAVLMCTHLAAFRTATNIRKRCMEHLTKTPLGYFLRPLRRRLQAARAGPAHHCPAHRGRTRGARARRRHGIHASSGRHRQLHGLRGRRQERQPHGRVL